MSSAAFAQLARDNPDYEGLFDRLEPILRRGDESSLYDPDDLGSMLNDARVSSALGLLQRAGVLQQIALVRCGCSTLVPQATYDAVMDEDGQYECSQCHRDLSNTPQQVRRFRLSAPLPPAELSGGRYTVVFVAGDRGGSQRNLLQTPKEFDSIQEAIQGSTHREVFHVANPVLAATHAKLVEAYRSRPAILHLAGHGNSRDLSFVLDQGVVASTVPLIAAQLCSILGGFPDRVYLCVLNTCDSLAIAERLTRDDVVDAAIGWPGRVDDDTAIEFTKTFYGCLANDLTLAQAVTLSNQGARATNPAQLFTAPDVDADVNPFLPKD